MLHMIRIASPTKKHGKFACRRSLVFLRILSMTAYKKGSAKERRPPTCDETFYTFFQERLATLRSLYQVLLPRTAYHI